MNPLWSNIFRLSIKVHPGSTRPHSFFQLSYELHREKSCDATRGGIKGYWINTFFFTSLPQLTGSPYFEDVIRIEYYFVGSCRPQVDL